MTNIIWHIQNITNIFEEILKRDSAYLRWNNHWIWLSWIFSWAWLHVAIETFKDDKDASGCDRNFRYQHSLIQISEMSYPMWLSVSLEVSRQRNDCGVAVERMEAYLTLVPVVFCWIIPIWKMQNTSKHNNSDTVVNDVQDTFEAHDSKPWSKFNAFAARGIHRTEASPTRRAKPGRPWSTHLPADD